MGRIQVRTQKTVTKPNGGSQSLGKISNEALKKQGRIHGYPSRVRVGMGHK